jgi:hypothetical protein
MGSAAQKLLQNIPLQIGLTIVFVLAGNEVLRLRTAFTNSIGPMLPKFGSWTACHP